MIAGVALALQLASPLAYVPPAPPRMPAVQAAGLDKMQVDVVLRSPEGVLWQGALTLSDGAGASWRESVSEGADCAARHGGGVIQREASIQLYRQRAGSSDRGDTVQVAVRWVRPATGAAACGATRIVELRQSVDLSTGPARLAGDGGLVVELRRR